MFYNMNKTLLRVEAIKIQLVELFVIGAYLSPNPIPMLDFLFILTALMNVVPDPLEVLLFPT